MPFLRGQVSYASFRITGPPASAVTIADEQLGALAEGVFAPSEAPSPPEIEAGFTGGDHIYDDRFDHEHNVLAGGLACHLALRVDTNRVPAEIKRAVQAQHHAAVLAESATGFLSRAEKKDLKDLVDHALREELSSGRHRRSKLIQLLWDVGGGQLLSGSGANTVSESLCAHWRSVMGGALEPISSGSLAFAQLQGAGRTRDFEDLSPSSFTEAPSADRPAMPEVSWARSGPEPHDFLGNEFLVWLWFMCESGDGAHDVGGRSVAVGFDRSLEAECAWGFTGRQSLSAHDGGLAPVRMREAAEALAAGKWVRKAGLVVAVDDMPFALTLQGDRWLISGCLLPEPSEKPESARELAEHRVASLLVLDGALRGLYARFIDVRASDRWSGVRGSIRSWIGERSRGRVLSIAEPKPEEPIRAAG